MDKTIAIDFDGVIHKYSRGWLAGCHPYDEPVDGAFKFMEELISKGHKVFIFSTREGEQIMDWLRKHNFSIPVGIISKKKVFWDMPGIIGITNIKLPANIYIDDRGINFNGSYDGLLSKIENFKTWNGEG